MSIEGKLQVVTGGTSGMGLETARELGTYGPVLIGGRSEKRLEAAMEDLRASGVEVYGKSVDISSRESVAEFGAYAQSLGTIGCVVNAAGVYSDTSDIPTITKINVGGAINMTREFMDRIEEGAFVHFSSVTGYVYFPQPEELDVWAKADDPDFCEQWRAAVNVPQGLPEHLNEAFPYYAASKRFVMFYTQANAMRFAKRGNRIFSVAPGSYDTPMFRSGNSTPEMILDGIALHRLGDANEMGKLVAQLAGPGHDYLTGVDVLMDGGMNAVQMVPQLP